MSMEQVPNFGFEARVREGHDQKIVRQIGTRKQKRANGEMRNIGCEISSSYVRIMLSALLPVFLVNVCLRKMSDNRSAHACTNHTGHPLLQNILEGRFYMERPSYRPSSASAQRPMHARGVLLDEELGQPMIKSLVEGEFYISKDDMSSKTKKMDYISHNRRMTKEYSKLVAATRPNSSMSSTGGGTRDISQQDTKGPPMYNNNNVAKPARARLVKDILTPRTPQELHQLWGRTLDHKFTESTLAWLEKASATEKLHFKTAIARHPIAGNATINPFAFAKSATPSQGIRKIPRPQSAPLSRPGTSGRTGASSPEMKMSSVPNPFRPQYSHNTTTVQPFKEIKDLQMAPFKTGYVDKHAIAEATAFARTRPPSRGGSAQSSRPVSASYERPLSAMHAMNRKAKALRVSGNEKRQIQGRDFDDVHSTIQQSTFGASWAAPCL